MNGNKELMRTRKRVGSSEERMCVFWVAAWVIGRMQGTEYVGVNGYDLG